MPSYNIFVGLYIIILKNVVTTDSLLICKPYFYISCVMVRLPEYFHGMPCGVEIVPERYFVERIFFVSKN